MLRTPCEYMMWQGLPVIRKEIAESMINNHSLSQKETAAMLKVTPAAICQYVSNKRGKTKIIDKTILKEIEYSAEQIINNGEESIIIETCRICRLLQEKKMFSFTSTCMCNQVVTYEK